MANNRMYLVHVPTGLAVSLAKSMADGWYMHKEPEQTLGARVNALIDATEHHEKPNDFAIAMEDESWSKLAIGFERYAGGIREDGLVQLVMKANSPA